MSDIQSPLTIDELTVLVLQHSRARMAKRKAARELLMSAREDERLKTVYLEIAKRISREEEAKESKMKLRSILLSVVMLVLLSFLLMGTVAHAQDATVEPVVTAIVEATPEIPVSPVQPVDATVSIWSMLLDKVGDIAMIAAIIVLAFMTGKLIPADVVLKSFDNGAAVIKTITAATPTSIDDTWATIIADVTRRVIAEELAKRDAAVVQAVSDPTAYHPAHDLSRGFDLGIRGGSGQ